MIGKILIIPLGAVLLLAAIYPLTKAKSWMGVCICSMLTSAITVASMLLLKAFVTWFPY